MKKLFTFMVAVFLTATLWAQSPNKMSYQAVIRNSSEALVTNTTVGMKISILQGLRRKAVYVETQSPTTNANGLISIKIGDGTVQSGNFTNIEWANGPYFIKTETDPAGGTNYTITGTSQLLSVPYALHAKTAESVSGTITATTYSVGDFAQGGIVFWVDETGQHGLVAAKEDQSTGVRWYNGSYTTVNAVRDGIGAGMYNTERIIANQGVGSYAAQLCANYQGGGYGDWYLPSKEELDLMYQNKATIDATAGVNGGSGFASASYWSSTEDSISTAHGPRASAVAPRAATIRTARAGCVLFGLFNYLSI